MVSNRQNGWKGKKQTPVASVKRGKKGETKNGREPMGMTYGKTKKGIRISLVESPKDIQRPPLPAIDGQKIGA
jgi:hypothetical protein